MLMPSDDAQHNPVRLDPDLQDLVPAYLQRRHADVHGLQEALELRNFATISLIGHRLRGNAATFGFQALEAIGENLEEAARDKAADRIAGCIAQMESFLMALHIHYA